MSIDWQSVVKEVYIDPIKSVLFIDDEFESFCSLIEKHDSSAMLNGTLNSEETGETFEEDADNLTTSEKGTVETSSAPVKTFPHYYYLAKSCREHNYLVDIENCPDLNSISHINKADFIILDYFLNGESGDNETCLGILDQLNSSDHFNLVSVYSNRDSSDILIALKDHFNITDTSYFSNNTRKWLKCDNLFISVIKKPVEDNDSIAIFLDDMVECLAEFKPSPILILLTKAMNEFSKSKEKHINETFKSEITRASILFHILSLERTSADAGYHINKSVGQLLERALNELSKSILPAVAGTGTSLLAETIDSEIDKISKSKEFEKLNTTSNARDMMLALNSFLCSTKNREEFITTGTILRDATKKDSYWLCVSPSCDMVPRDRTGQSCHRAKIYPFNYFEAIRLKRLKGRHIDDALKNAENGRAIFLCFNSEYYVFQVLSEGSREPNVYIFYAPNRGVITGGDYCVNQVVCNEGNLVFQQHKVKAIGQLRQEYSDRFLVQKSNYTSRIGVDFRKYDNGQQE